MILGEKFSPPGKFPKGSCTEEEGGRAGEGHHFRGTALPGEWTNPAAGFPLQFCADGNVGDASPTSSSR
jgi:hypothetical protein